MPRCHGSLHRPSVRGSSPRSAVPPGCRDSHGARRDSAGRNSFPKSPRPSGRRARDARTSSMAAARQTRLRRAPATAASLGSAWLRDVATARRPARSCHVGQFATIRATSRSARTSMNCVPCRSYGGFQSGVSHAPMMKGAYDASRRIRDRTTIHCDPRKWTPPGRPETKCDSFPPPEGVHVQRYTVTIAPEDPVGAQTTVKVEIDAGGPRITEVTMRAGARSHLAAANISAIDFDLLLRAVMPPVVPAPRSPDNRDVTALPEATAERPPSPRRSATGRRGRTTDTAGRRSGGGAATAKPARVYRP